MYSSSFYIYELLTGYPNSQCISFNCSGTMLLKVIFITLLAAVSSVPVVEKASESTKNKKTNTLLAGESNPKITPQEEFPDLTDMIEVKEEDIPEGTMVLEVDEPIQEKIPGETMETANNVVFRPLFRYREKQSARRVGQANRRYRRRYYVPRRSYRPYRSAYYYSNRYPSNKYYY